MPINGTTPNKPSRTVMDAPALGTLNNSTLYVAWRDGSDKLAYMTSQDGINFSAPVPVGGVDKPETSPHAPVLAEFNGTLYISWTGKDSDSKLNVMPINATKPKTLESSETAPSLSVAGGQLYLAWTGTNSNHSLNLISSVDGVNFGTKSTLNQSTNAGLCIAAFAGV